MDKKTGLNLGYAIFALLAMMLLRDWWTQLQTVDSKRPRRAARRW
jgi:hypothetical protein